MQRLFFTCSRQRSHFNYFSWHRVLNTPCLVTRHNTHTRRSHRMLLLFVCVWVCATVCYVLTIEIGLFHCFSSVQDLLPLSRVQFAQHETNASVPRKTGEPKPDSTCAEQLRLITWKGLVEYDHSYCSENGPNGRWWNETREDLSMGTVFSLILLEKDI